LWNDLSPPPNPREFNGIVLYILVLNQQQSCQSVDSREAIFAKIYSILISYSVLPYWQCHLDDNLSHKEDPTVYTGITILQVKRNDQFMFMSTSCKQRLKIPEGQS
jgi:hypothetical protein